MFDHGGPAAFWRRAILFIAVGLSVGLSGCGSVAVPLPDLSQKSTEVMTSEEQAAAIEEMTRRQASHEQESIEQIEGQRDI